MEVGCSSGSDARVAVRTRRRKCGEDWEVMTADGCPLTSLSVCSPDQSLCHQPVLKYSGIALLAEECAWSKPAVNLHDCPTNSL